MEDVQSNQVIKYKILDVIEGFTLLQEFTKHSDQVVLYGELDIEPFEEFSIEFQAEYWYIKYMLLRDGKFNMEKDNYKERAFWKEKKLNVIWLSVKNNDNVIVECNDGEWFINFPTQSQYCKPFWESYKLLEL